MELLLNVKERHLAPEDEHLRPYRFRAGDVITIMPDGHPWSKIERTHPEWRIVRAPILPTFAIFVSKHARQSPRSRQAPRPREHYIDLAKLPSPHHFLGERQHEIIELEDEHVRAATCNKRPFTEELAEHRERLNLAPVAALAMIAPISKLKFHRRRLLQFLGAFLALTLVRKAKAQTINTIGTSSRTYSTVAAWLAACPANLVTSTEIWEGQVYNDSLLSSGSTISLTGITTSASFYVFLTAAAGQSFQDNAGIRTNALKFNQSNGAAISCTATYTECISDNIGYTQITKLQIQAAHNGYCIASPAGGNNALFKDLICFVNGVGAAYAVQAWTSTIVANVLVFIGGATGGGFEIDNGASAIACCAIRTSDNSPGGTGFVAKYTTELLQSCCSFGFTSPTGGTGTWDGTNSKNSATDQSSGLPGVGQQYSITFNSTSPFTNSSVASQDSRPVTGTNLSANGFLNSTYAPNDISGTSRSGTPTIGVWQLSGGSTKPPGQFPRISQRLGRIAALLMLLLLASVRAFAVSNSVTITDETGSTQTSRPFSISRVFADGDIPNYAQPSISGTPLITWQCDKKNTWPDGSLKHAIISFTTTIPASSSVTVSFVNNASSSSAGSALTQSQMLSFATSWNIHTAATNGTTLTTDARTMLTAGTWSYWLQGPVVTQVIVEDRSTSLANDFGWDANKSLHPIFVLTFYPGWAGVKEEAIVENCWTTKLEDISYSVVVANGASYGNTVYSDATFSHYAGGRWRQTAWDGTTPGSVKIDYNLAYMAYSRALPNYDTTRVVGANALTYEVADFNASDKGVNYGNNAQWATYMPTTGGRPDIGWTTRWNVRYLYTFDPTMQPVFAGNAQVSGYVPIHYRESGAGVSPYFCAVSCTGANATVSAFGHPLSIDSRPSIWVQNWGSNQTNAGDVITPISALSYGPWTTDQAHQGDFAYIPYLITGDWYYLEELYFWGSWNLANNNPQQSSHLCRGLSWGFFNYIGIQPRGQAWSLRTLADVVMLVPDGTPEAQYFTAKLNNNIAINEGRYNITAGSFPPSNSSCPGFNIATTTDKWCWGRMGVEGGLSNPLYLPLWDSGSAPTSTYINNSVTQWMVEPWEDNYYRVALGFINDFFPGMKYVQQVMAINQIHLLADPAAVAPWTEDMYQTPVQNMSSQYFQTWSAWLGGFVSSVASATTWIDLTDYPIWDVENAYAQIARAAASFIPQTLTDGGFSGATAWANINAVNAATIGGTGNNGHAVSDQPGLGTNIASCTTTITWTSQMDSQCDNPKWAMLPRSQNGLGSSVISSGFLSNGIH